MIAMCFVFLRFSLQVCTVSWQLQSNVFDSPLHFSTSVFNPDLMRVIHDYRQHDYVPTTPVRSSSDSCLSVNGIWQNTHVEQDVFFATTLICQHDLKQIFCMSFRHHDLLSKFPYRWQSLPEFFPSSEDPCKLLSYPLCTSRHIDDDTYSLYR